MCLTTSSNTVIAGSYSNEGLYYSENKGKKWKKSNITSGDFYSLAIIDDIVIASSNFRKSLYYSEDNGKTWNWSNID